MKITIVAVGRTKKTPEHELTEHYLHRFNGAGGSLGFAKATLIEVEEKRPIKGAERQSREADLLLNAVPESASIIVLDERGKAITSKSFADHIAKMRDQGTRDLVFLIGGADGFDPKVRARADRLISFGPATWPHMLVRTMLTEQLYRAATILAGHPYHKV